MKLHEVLVKVTPYKEWFRPVGWKGFRAAYCIKDGHTYAVPHPRGGCPLMGTNVETLTGDWEIVTPDEVLDGK